MRNASKRRSSLQKKKKKKKEEEEEEGFCDVSLVRLLFKTSL
jgi:hypothetical protein